MNLRRALWVAAIAVSYSGSAHAHLGATVLFVPAASLVLGIVIGVFTLPRLARSSKLLMFALALAVPLAYLTARMLSGLPGTDWVRLLAWWLILFSMYLYIPYQLGRLGMSALLSRVLGERAPAHRLARGRSESP